MSDTATVEVAAHVHIYPAGGGRCACGARRCRAQLCPEPRTLGKTCDRHASARARQCKASRLAQAIPQGRPVRVTVYALPPKCRGDVTHHPERPSHPLYQAEGRAR